MTLLGIVACGFLFLAVFGKNAAGGALKVIGVLVLLFFGLAFASVIRAQHETPSWMVEDTRPDPNWPGIPPPGHHFNKFGYIYPNDDDHGGAAAR